MKNLVFMLTAILTLSIISCESVDKELVDKMQKDITEMGGLTSAFSELDKTINDLGGQIIAAPEAMRSGDNPELKNIQEMSGAFMQKSQATQAEYNDLMSKLKALAADYSAGKITTEDAQKEYETLKTGLQGISDLVQRIQERAGQMEANFAKMTADWNAKHEGETAPAPK